jgi:NAD(P)H dehydrogenase (quinone)
MTRILVLYYSSYGHIERMAEAVASGARETGADVVLKRVPELVPEDVMRKAGYKLDQAAAIADPPELADYDAILIGTPTRFGNMASQMKNFLDRLGGVWTRDGLVGKVGSVFTSADAQHGGHESTILATHVVLLHLGMMVVGLPYTFKGQLATDAPVGGSPYGASTLAGGGRQPSEKDLDGASFQGRYVAEVARALALGRRHAVGGQ